MSVCEHNFSAMSFSRYTNQKNEEVLRIFSVDIEHGLSSDEIIRRQQRYGRNELDSKELTAWGILLRQFYSPFVYLLIAAAFLSLFLGEKLNAAFIFFFVAINVILGFFQEYRSENTLRLLKQYIVSQSWVRRNSTQSLVETQLLVPGDIILLEAGDIVPADMRILDSYGLLINESTLTGEAESVHKESSPLRKKVQHVFQAKNIAFTGTTVLSGRAVGVVIATGRKTVMGDITTLTVETHRVSTFEKGIHRISIFILRLIILCLVLVFVGHLLLKGNSVSITDLLLFSIALAVSVIPEALPTVTTLSLSRGAYKLARNKVVVKRLSAIEDLGSIEVLCTDKTGTLTEDKMEVAEILAVSSREVRVTQDEVLLYANLGGRSVFTHDGHPASDFDRALSQKVTSKLRHATKLYDQIEHFPFDPERRRDDSILRRGEEYFLIARGAPESIMNLCHPISSTDERFFTKWIRSQGKLGNRVMAVARRDASEHNHTNITLLEKNMELLGLIAFSDPLKKSAREAISRAKKLAVQVKILTGDRPEVAAVIALKVGLIQNVKDVITGESLDRLSHVEQLKAVELFAVFARVTPQQKYHIIELLQEKYEVGFLGEGMNDAPALKIARVGLVVQGASDIAKESADIVLLHKNLEVIVSGIEEGRHIFANTTKYIRATLASNFGNFFAVASASFFIDFLPMLPIQLLLVNLLSDFPMMAIATDHVDPQELQRPRKHQIKDIALIALVLGVVSSLFDFLYFGLFFHNTPGVLQTNWFIASILTELVFIYSVRTKLSFMRSHPPTWTLLLLTIIVAVITITLPYTDFGIRVFKFTPPSWSHLILILGVVGLYFVVTEKAKLFYYRYASLDEAE